MTTATALPERVAALPTITLDAGAHILFEEGHCAMEVVAWLAGESVTDAPVCASPVLRTFTIAVNDAWDDEQRQKLVPFLPRMVGTAGDGMDEARSFLALDWLVRTYTPAWLDLAGLTTEAAALRGLPPIVDMTAAGVAGQVVRAAREKATAAWDAAWAAAGAAAGDTAGAATRAAAGAAAWDAAWAAARAAAGAAAWAAAGAAAWSAAGAAAGDTARDTTRDTTRAAARDAARDALAPTVTALQASAIDLLDRMIDPAVKR